jgi:hypothetical protein
MIYKHFCSTFDVSYNFLKFMIYLSTLLRVNGIEPNPEKLKNKKCFGCLELPIGQKKCGFRTE